MNGTKDRTLLPEDAIDFHVHAGPSYWPRKQNAIELARQIRDIGFGGAVLKSHFGNTFGIAELTNDVVPDVTLYSSLTLNTFVGGFNPSAVELALHTGTNVVWMPTFSAAHFDATKHYPFSNQNLSVLDGGELLDSVVAILDMLADADRKIVLGNGHLSPTESWAILDYIQEQGLSLPYLVTHADSEFMKLSVEDQIQLADAGAYIEKSYLPIVYEDLTLQEMVASIRQIGVERCVLSTDHGQPDNESPPVAFANFVDLLHELGITHTEISIMARDNPKSLL